jgi:hypothetical protein
LVSVSAFLGGRPSTPRHWHTPDRGPGLWWVPGASGAGGGGGAAEALPRPRGTLRAVPLHQPARISSRAQYPVGYPVPSAKGSGARVSLCVWVRLQPVCLVVPGTDLWHHPVVRAAATRFMSVGRSPAEPRRCALGHPHLQAEDNHLGMDHSDCGKAKKKEQQPW